MTDAAAEFVDRCWRSFVDYYVLSSGAANTVHLPGPDSTRDDPRPLCKTTLNVRNEAENVRDWTAKELAVLPPGFHGVCNRCQATLNGDTMA